MIRKVQRAWFEVWGDAESQNQILKVLLAYFVLLATVLSIIVTILALRRPALVGVSQASSWLLDRDAVPPERWISAEITRVVTRYASSHHNWTWKTIEDSFASLAPYISSGYEKEFSREAARIRKLAAEKRLSQRFHFDDQNVSLNLDKKTARISGDRILIVEGLRAANPYAVEVSFEYGSRTKNNPEGIYITGEKRFENPDQSNGERN